jgi:WD40 repeat protein
MEYQQILTCIDCLFLNKTGKHLSDLQRTLLYSCLTETRSRYEDLAREHGYSLNYLKQDVGPKLWKIISDICGERVNKTNLRSALERKCQQENFRFGSDPAVATSKQLDPALALLNSSEKVAVKHRDWGEAPAGSRLFNRTQELSTLTTWIVEDRCRSVFLSGMAGIGKTHLSIELATRIEHHFEYVVWRSLAARPTLSALIQEILMFLTCGSPENLPIGLTERLSLSIDLLSKKRCLLILDNVEAIFNTGTLVGRYRSGYEDYQKFFQCLGERNHDSCLLAIATERPQEIILMQGETLPVRSLKLAGLNVQAGRQLLESEGCFLESDVLMQMLVERYGGNPLALRVVSAIAADLYQGNIAEFVSTNPLIPHQIAEILDRQFQRLHESEQHLLYWLALHTSRTDRQQWYQLDTEGLFTNDEVKRLTGCKIHETIRSLLYRAWLEINDNRFCLVPIVYEYLCGNLLDRLVAEIESERIVLLNKYPLLDPYEREYLKQHHVRSRIVPILDRLLEIYRHPAAIATKLQGVLAQLRQQRNLEPGYAAGNIINLLGFGRSPIGALDCSNLVIKSACLEAIDLHDVDFTNADLSGSSFAKQLTTILTLAFSPNGKLLATGDVNGEILIWEIATGEPLAICKGHASRVHSIAFSHDGRMLGSGSSDRTLKLWDVLDGSCIKTLSGHQQRVRSIAFSSDDRTIVSGSSDATVRVWDVHSGECLQICSGHRNYVWAVAFSPDDRLLASGSEDKTIRIWEVATGECLHELTEHQLWVRAIAFSPDGRLLASGGGDRTLKIWDVDTGKCTHTLQGHTQRLRSIAFSPDGRAIASGSGDRTARIWQVGDGRCLKTFHGHDSMLTAVAFSPDGLTLATGSEDRSVRLWEVDTGRCSTLWQGYGSWIQSLAFSPDGRTLASGSEDKTVRIWQLATQTSSVSIGHQGWVCSVAFSPDGLTLASGSSDYSVKIWDTATGHCLKTFRGHNRWIGSVAFSPDGLMLASCSGDYKILVWDAITGNIRQTLTKRSGWLRSVAFSPDGLLLGSAAEDPAIELWNVGRGECVRTLVGHTSWVQSISFSPDGKLLASASCDCTIRIWSVATGECLKILHGHTNWVQTVKFSPDGQTLASGSCDRTVKLWDVRAERCLQTILAHQSWVWSVDFSPDGRIVASGGQDETIHLWDIVDRQCVARLRTKRPYEGMCITGAQGLSAMQRESLKSLGAVERV